MRKLYFLFLVFFVNSFFIATAQDVANFTFTINAANKVVQFTNTSTISGDAARKAFWTFGDGKAAVTLPKAGIEHQYATTGTYNVCLKIYKYFVGDSVLSSQECKQVVIASSATTSCTADFEYRDSAFSNSGGHRVYFTAKTFNLTNKPIAQVCWTFGDGTDTCINSTSVSAATSLLNVQHNYKEKGNYNTCLRIKYADGCVAEKCKIISLQPQAVTATCKADFTTESMTNSTLSKKFSALPTHSQQKKPLKICWKFGDGKTECKEYNALYTGSFNTDHTYGASGLYEVCATILYDGGCEAKICKLVKIESPQVAACEMKFSEAATSITNLKRTFYASVMTSRAAEKICWNFGDGKESCTVLTNPLEQQSLIATHEYAAPGVYRVCAKVLYAGGCVAEYCREVVIRSGSNTCGGYMTDSVSELRTVLFKGFGIQNANDRVVSYRWAYGDGISGTGQQVKHTYATAGNYEVCLTMITDRGCETRICKRLSIAGNNEPVLLLTPNPVVNELHLTFRSIRQEMLTITIYNATGVAVKTYQRNAVIGQNNWGVDVSGLAAGIYSLIIKSPYQLANALFTKQ